MSLQSLFKRAAQLAVQASGDIAVTCTYKKFVGKSYNDNTGAVTTSETNYPGIRVILGPFTRSYSEFIKNIQVNDIKGLIAFDDLGIEPTTGDTITITSSSSATYKSGNVYNVLSGTTDASEALLTLHLRAVT